MPAPRTTLCLKLTLNVVSLVTGKLFAQTRIALTALIFEPALEMWGF